MYLIQSLLTLQDSPENNTMNSSGLETSSSDGMCHMTVSGSDILTLYILVGQMCHCELRQTGDHLLQQRTMIQLLINFRTTPKPSRIK